MIPFLHEANTQTIAYIVNVNEYLSRLESSFYYLKKYFIGIFLHY